MLALGVDTSNYATSLAVVDLAAREVVCSVKRFLPVKAGQMGLRQSDAVFHHTMALPALGRELAAKLSEKTGRADALQQVKLVAVSEKPRPQEGSYMPCFAAGASFAEAFALGAGAALVRTTHQQGHLAAALFGAGQPKLYSEKVLFFHLSGGTTEMLLASGYDVLGKLGGSLDLYAGQAVDRLGVKLGFAFPAGAQLSALAAEHDGELDEAPRVTVKGMDCHLSGLENQCEKLLADGKQAAYAAKYCLLSIAETVVRMAKAARKQCGPLPVLCAGGVMSSNLIREHVTKRLGDAYFAPPEYSADNAVGVAFIAEGGPNG